MKSSITNFDPQRVEQRDSIRQLKNNYGRMKSIAFLLSLFLLFGTGCQRRLSATEVKNNLEKAMSTYLREHQRPGTAPLRFDMVDVHYQEDDSTYQCQFTIKLYRPDGSDTTGIVSSKISKDFSTVSAK